MPYGELIREVGHQLTANTTLHKLSLQIDVSVLTRDMRASLAAYLGVKHDGGRRPRRDPVRPRHQVYVDLTG
ncbi:MAG: hypothetical protein ACRD3T_13475 [Terriglobia bacterium]